MSIQENKLFIPASTQDQILDSYDLISSILGEMGGQNNLTYKLDGSLPVIVGSPTDLKSRFMEIIVSLIKENSLNHLSVYVSHIKDPNNWIFTFLVNIWIGDAKRGKEMLLNVDPVKSSLSIPKRGSRHYPIYLL